MDFDTITNELVKISDLITGKGGRVKLELQEGATDEEIKACFKNTPVPAPIYDCLRMIDINYSFGGWMRPDSMPEKLWGFRSGLCKWVPRKVLERENERKKHVRKSKKPNPEKLVDELWERCFAFSPSFGPQFAKLAIDPRLGRDSPVYRLCEEKGVIGHGAVLGETFEAFFINWVRVGFVANSEAWLALTDDFTRPLDADCKVAKDWRNWLSADA